ncbi:MAG: hypothetical protein Q4F65_14495 [Propionibacteriaceae bacterium]|nr:hypothetical protein [Propionibacteriaceae bacterium]
MNKAVRVLAAGVCVGALALTGCVGSPGSAATVGGVGIADDAVRSVANTIVEASGTRGDIALKQATYDLLLGEASRQIAATTGAQVSSVEKSAVVSQNQLVAAVSALPGGEAWGDAVGTTYVVLEDLGEDTYLEELRKLDIEVNPRYGQWDPAQVTLVDSSLATTAPAIVN